MIAPVDAPTLKDYGRMLVRGWTLILAATVLSAAAAWAASFLVEPTYTAVSRVFVTTPGPPSTRASLDGNRAALVRVESYVELVTGEQVLRRVIVQQGLTVTPDELANAITVTPSPGSALIGISVVDADPEAARDIANSVAVQLIGLTDEIDIGADGPVSQMALVDAAIAPDSATSPQPIGNMMLGAGMGAALAAVLVLGWGIARNSIDHRDQVENIVTASQLGGTSR